MIDKSTAIAIGVTIIVGTMLIAFGNDNARYLGYSFCGVGVLAFGIAVLRKNRV